VPRDDLRFGDGQVLVMNKDADRLLVPYHMGVGHDQTVADDKPGAPGYLVLGTRTLVFEMDHDSGRLDPLVDIRRDILHRRH
jgi:hypothetical protein